MAGLGLGLLLALSPAAALAQNGPAAASIPTSSGHVSGGVGGSGGSVSGANVNGGSGTSAASQGTGTTASSGAISPTGPTGGSGGGSAPSGGSIGGSGMSGSSAGGAPAATSASGSGSPAASSAGGGGGGLVSQSHGGPTVEQSLTVDPSELTSGGLLTGTAALPAASGGSVLAGNVAVSLPAGALASVASTSASVNVSVQAAASLHTPGGAARFSPNGTLADLAVTTSAGQSLTTFPAPITLTLKYNAADLTMAGGDPSRLTVAFVIDASSPEIENPLHFPVGTLAAAPVSDVSLDTAGGVLRVRTQALGSVVAVVTNPVAYVQTLETQTPLYSSFDPSQSAVLGTRGQFSYLQLVEPQIGNRFLTVDPTTGGYAYVDASMVGQSSGPSNVAVVRGLRRL